MFKDIDLPASFYVETFELTGGKPIFTHDGKIAGVTNTFGKGTTYLFGTFPFLSTMHVNKNPAVESLLKTICSKAGVKLNRQGKLIFRRLVSDKGELLFVINPTDKTVTHTLKLKANQSAEFFKDGKKSAGQIKVDAFSVEAIVITPKA
ncbi:MAG: hypothetical protein GX811_10600 [Lentisphaerae bacterium]|nr:hypothetical protein [Lentisphaerota bacterium]